MAIREIKKYPESVLKEQTERVEEFNEELQELIEDMIETMYAAPGVGLAANQVGVARQVTVIDVSLGSDKEALIVLVNPEIIHCEDEESAEEGCLSIPGYTTMVKRFTKVKVKAQDRKGQPVEIEGEGLLARAMQHELDHLSGKLFIDRIGRIKREFFKKRYSRDMVAGKK